MYLGNWKCLFFGDTFFRNNNWMVIRIELAKPLVTGSSVAYPNSKNCVARQLGITQSYFGYSLPLTRCFLDLGCEKQIDTVKWVGCQCHAKWIATPRCVSFLRGDPFFSSRSEHDFVLKKPWTLFWISHFFRNTKKVFPSQSPESRWVEELTDGGEGWQGRIGRGMEFPARSPLPGGGNHGLHAPRRDFFSFSSNGAL